MNAVRWSPESYLMLILEDKTILDQVERILHSEELRGSEVLRRLLKFLAEKSVCGEADELKEYIVAIDGLGKPASYDPRHNSAVRIQVGRLRQKLADYYRTEGIDDPVVIDVPKGRFKLTCENRTTTSAAAAASVAPPIALPLPVNPPINNEDSSSGKGRARFTLGALLLWVGVAVAIALGLYSWMQPWSARATNVASTAGWTPELEDLWGPFLASKRPLIVAIEDPLFVEVQWGSGIYYRDKSLNHWNDVSTSPAVVALRNALHNPKIQPSQYYTAFGEVDVSFLIGKLLGPRVQNFSLVKISDLSWQQLADNNVLFVGVQNLFFDEQLQAMPIEAQLLPVFEGIRNVHPKAGEPALFADQFSTAPSEEGVAYALVTHLPGPLGSNDVESFTSNRSAGYVAAVKAFADPSFARVVVDRLRQTSGGRMPRYYQVLLKVKFKDEVPTETTCVLTRELR
jgi:hypothetical protein